MTYLLRALFCFLFAAVSPVASAAGGKTTCTVPGVWDTTFGTAQVNSDLSGQMWYHYYQNGQLVYYTFSVPLSVTLNGQNGFKVDVPESALFYQQTYDLTFTDSTCGRATGTYKQLKNGDVIASGNEWWARPSISVTNANLDAGTVSFTLYGPSNLNLSATVTFTMLGNAGKTFSYTTPDTYGPGTYTIPLPRTSIKKDMYKSISGTWNLAGALGPSTFTPPAPWNVLGVVRYSQYNTPDEFSCSGASSTAWVVSSLTNCTFINTTLDSDFQSQTAINGTGVSNSWGILKAAAASTLSKSCRNKFPAGATVGNSFVQVPSVTGACNTVLVSGSSTAVYPTPIASRSPLTCGAGTLLVDSQNNSYGNKSVADRCPACAGDFRNTEGHIDSYTSNPACGAHDIPDLGDYWTLKQ